MLLSGRRIPTGGADNGIRDVVQVRRGRLGQLSSAVGAAHGCITLTERLLARRTTTKDDVAREEALVLATLAIGRDGIFRWRCGRFSDWRLDSGWKGARLGFLSLPRFHRAQTLLRGIGQTR